MARLQAEMAGEPEVRLVTFTVDPDHDQPEELKEYAAHFQADPERWLFLTGPQEELYRLIRDSFRLGVQPNQGTARSPGSEVTHSTKLALVDRHGHLRGYFAGEPMTVAGQPQDDLARLRAAIATLLQEKS
jgi:protein SCO1/2